MLALWFDEYKAATKFRGPKLCVSGFMEKKLLNPFMKNSSVKKNLFLIVVYKHSSNRFYISDVFGSLNTEYMTFKNAILLFEFFRYFPRFLRAREALEHVDGLNAFL